jgi:predicted dienelactone hydrolase
MITHSVRISFCLFLLLVCGHTAAAYDPLALPADASGRICDLTARDEARSRDLPLRVYLPRGSDAAPVVLFSHGLGGTCQGSAFLGKHWSARGYVAVFMQHPGSDDSVWKEEPRAKRMAAMEQAASGKQFFDRVRDVPAVLKQLDVWNKQAGHALSGRVDLTRVGMSGHSFGAVTTQAVSGQSAAVIGQRFTDPRIRAAIAFSPSIPRRGDPATAFGSVRIPWMLMTGTKDTAPIGGQTVESRLAVYPHLPAKIDKYELVLHNAEHSAFTERSLPGDRQQRNPNHHRAILALSTAFWDAHLRSDDAARGWLHGTEARSVLESKDGWQFHSAQQRE